MVGVFLSGAGGAGKTTLTGALESCLGDFRVINEVARRICRENKLTRDDFREPRKHLDLQTLILQGER